jgi:hypothetical protein
MTPDTYVAIGGLLMLAGCTVLIRWVPDAWRVINEVWDFVRTRPSDQAFVSDRAATRRAPSGFNPSRKDIAQ